MYEGWPPPGARTESRRRNERAIIRRPDRIALWAVGLAFVAMVAAAASAHAASGGTGATGARPWCMDRDRSPSGWDLTKRTAKELDFTHTDDIRAAPIKEVGNTPLAGVARDTTAARAATFPGRRRAAAS